MTSKPIEEVLQKFIENHPLLLQQFPAERLFFKPSILGVYKADFGIVTPHKELVLIEIENAKTRLLTRSGDVASDLTHAFGQVERWLDTVNDHKLAVLDALGIPRDEVGVVRGVVIAGVDAGWDVDNLRKLKGRNRTSNIPFYTFDDLASSLEAVARGIEAL